MIMEDGNNFQKHNFATLYQEICMSEHLQQKTWRYRRPDDDVRSTDFMDATVSQEWLSCNDHRKILRTFLSQRS